MDQARKIVAWTVKTLQADDGLFDDRMVVASGEVKRGKLTYNSALMLRALLGLYQADGKKEYLEQAQRIAKAADWFLNRRTGVYRDAVQYSHFMVEADLDLYRTTKEEYLLKRAKRNVDAFYEKWKAKPPDDMISNAAIARVLWLMAETETDAGRASPAGSRIMMCEGYVGIGLDEATALVVQGGMATSLGKGKVYFYGGNRRVKEGQADYEAPHGRGRGMT